jgi:hypothetical protein
MEIFVDRLLEEQQQFNAEYFSIPPVMGWSNHYRGSIRRRGRMTVARNKPHITLAAFQAGEEAEDTLIRWIQRICHQHQELRDRAQQLQRDPTAHDLSAGAGPGTIAGIDAAAAGDRRIHPVLGLASGQS